MSRPEMPRAITDGAAYSDMSLNNLSAICGSSIFSHTHWVDLQTQPNEQTRREQKGKTVSTKHTLQHCGSELHLWTCAISGTSLRISVALQPQVWHFIHHCVVFQRPMCGISANTHRLDVCCHRKTNHVVTCRFMLVWWQTIKSAFAFQLFYNIFWTFLNFSELFWTCLMNFMHLFVNCYEHLLVLFHPVFCGIFAIEKSMILFLAKIHVVLGCDFVFLGNST